MNIIQIQDRLKGVSDDALKGYVTDPTGEVPTYLALGEIGRREDVRKEYQAAQAQQPQKTVAEEKLAAMPKGIGSLTQGMATPEPQGIAQPPMTSMNPAIAETGVANLPTPNMPQQNFEAGGIVQPTLANPDPYADARAQWNADKAAGKQRFNKDFMQFAREYNGEPPLTNEQFRTGLTPPPTAVSDIMDTGTPAGVGAGMEAKVQQEKNAPATGIAQNALQANLQGEVDLAEARNKKARRDQRPTEGAASEKSLQDYVDEFQNALGEDPAKAGMAARKARIDARAERSAKDAPWDAMINAGLTMAAGQSSDAITNIARGSLSGVNTYQKRLDALDSVEEKQLLLETQMTKIDRAERIAAVEYGMQSEQFKQTQELKQQLADQKNYLDALTIQIKSAESEEKRRNNIAGTTDDIVDQESQEIEEWTERWFRTQGREYDLEDPEFKVAKDIMMKDRIARRRGGNARIDDSKFKIIRD